MRCEEIMRREVVRAGPNETVQAAAAKMRDAELSSLPICSASGEVIGLLTERDLLVRVCAEGRSPTAIVTADVMSLHALSCRASDDLSRAVALMNAEQKPSILVLDEEERLVGMIQRADLEAGAAEAHP